MGHRCDYFCLLKGRHSGGPHEKCSWGGVGHAGVGLDRVGCDVVGHAVVGWGIGVIIFVY